MGTSIVEAAFGIHDLINETMAAAAKTHIAEKGGNPNIVTVSAFGGRGSGARLWTGQKNRRSADSGAAAGRCRLGTRFFHRPGRLRSDPQPSGSPVGSRFRAIEELFDELEREGRAILQQADESQEVQFERTLQMRFVGQGAETDLSIETKPFHNWTIEDIRDRFDERLSEALRANLPGHAGGIRHFQGPGQPARTTLPIPPLKRDRRLFQPTASKGSVWPFRSSEGLYLA